MDEEVTSSEWNNKLHYIKVSTLLILIFINRGTWQIYAVYVPLRLNQ